MSGHKRKELFRDTHRGKVAGVCAGVANYLSWEVWLIRILFFTGLVLNFPLFSVIYIAAWLILSKDNTQLGQGGYQEGKHKGHNRGETKNGTVQGGDQHEGKTYASNYSPNYASNYADMHRKNVDNESIKVKARVWQAGEPPKQALQDIYIKFKKLEKKLNNMEQHVTASHFDLSREIDKL